MDIESVAGNLGQIAKVLGYFGGGAFVGGWVYIVFRTGSLHLLRRRIWKFLHGEEAVNDPDIQELIDDRTKLMIFCYEVGFRVHSLGRAKLMAKWLKDNDEDVRTIKAMGPFFDRDRVCLVSKLPPKRRLSTFFVLIVIVAMFLSIAAIIASSTRGYFTVRKTGLSFSASSSDVRGTRKTFSAQSSFPWFTSIDAPKMSIDMCTKNKFSEPAFPMEDREVLCQFLADPEKESRIEKAVTEQRVGMGMLSVPAGMALGFLILLIRQLERAWSVERRIRERAAQRSDVADREEG